MPVRDDFTYYCGRGACDKRTDLCDWLLSKPFEANQNGIYGIA